MSFRDALNATYLAPLEGTRNRLISQLEELVPQAQNCKSYSEIRSLCVRSWITWSCFRNAHFECKVNPDMDSRRLSSETRLKIALTALKDMIEYKSYLKSDECDKATALAESEWARKSQTMHPYAWADSPEEYYGGGTAE